MKIKQEEGFFFNKQTLDQAGRMILVKYRDLRSSRKNDSYLT